MTLPSFLDAPPRRIALRLALPALLALAAAGCSDKRDTAKDAAQKGQVIAKVGPSDITIHELQNEYRHLNLTADKINDDTVRAVLNELVKRKYLTQRAQAAGLDREPTVLLDVLRSREQALSTALVQRDIQTKIAGIGKNEIDRYINANPLRFGKRVRLNIEQLTIPAETAKADFYDSVKEASTLDEIEKKAIERGMLYSRGIGALYSGDIPEELLTKARTQKATDVFFVRNGPSGVFFKVKGEEPDPLSGDAATQRAQQLLRTETAQAELGKKVGAGEAEISYFGDYTAIMANAPAAGAATQPAAQPPKTN